MVTKRLPGEKQGPDSQQVLLTDQLLGFYPDSRDFVKLVKSNGHLANVSSASPHSDLTTEMDTLASEACWNLTLTRRDDDSRYQTYTIYIDFVPKSPNIPCAYVRFCSYEEKIPVRTRSLSYPEDHPGLWACLKQHYQEMCSLLAAGPA